MISTNQIAYLKRSAVFLKMTKSFSLLSVALHHDFDQSNLVRFSNARSDLAKIDIFCKPTQTQNVVQCNRNAFYVSFVVNSRRNFRYLP